MIDLNKDTFMAKIQINSFRLEIKQLLMHYSICKIALPEEKSIDDIKSDIKEELGYLEARNIQSVDNRITFRNSIIDRKFQLTLMGVLSGGEFDIIQSNGKSELDFRCNYSLMYDLAFIVLGIVFSIFINTQYSIWCLGGVIGFFLRLYVVSTKCNELITKITG
ncbi:hypothetical protein [Parabacteroides sp. FAFU027]|uniref:hypothetical protein n=1 Tax=Parabacteroides sp. FAFU027 TaxID=2922715 RepID=UPI001FAEE501|nr:hypothetical protein [Parabacteroides sp. FAFU027]